MASTYLTRTPSSTGNRRKFTFSAWVKFNFNGLSNNARIFGCGNATTAWVSAYFLSDATLQLAIVDSGNVYTIQTNRKFRDENAYYNLVFVVDTENATANNRLRIYVNGQEETSFSQRNNPTQNLDTQANTASKPIDIGSAENIGYSPRYFPGIMSHVHMSDGYVYDASAFGSTDNVTGEWKINTSPSVTYGTNGFFILKDGNSVTDQSGNSNNFTVGGTLTKTEDCPSNVFATWNPLHHSTQSISNVVFKNGNTTFDNNETGSAVYPQSYSTLAASSGKYYFESKLIATNTDASFIGISGAVTTEAYVGENAYTYVYRSNGVVRNNDTDGNTYTSYGVNDIIQIAVDLDNNKLYFGINGTWVNSGDPTSGATGTGAVYTITAPSNTPHGVYHFTLGDTSSTGSFEHATNFGNGYFGTTAVSSAGTNASGIGIFEYDVPTGYTALSTKGLNE